MKAKTKKSGGQPGRGTPQPKGYRRQKLASAVEARIWEAVGELAMTFKHTRAWVVNVILAEYLHIKLDDDYFLQGYVDQPRTAKARARRRPRKGKK